MHSYVFGHVNFGLVLLSVFYALMLRAATVDTDELEKLVAQGLIDALNSAHLSIKEAAYFMDIDESQLRKQLRCEPHQHLSLYKVIKLPFIVWFWFGPCLMQIIYRKRMMEFAQEVNEMKRSA